MEKNPRGDPVTSVTLWITVSRVMMTRSGKNFAELTSQSAFFFLIGHFTYCCRPNGFSSKNRVAKKAKVNVLSAETAAPDAPVSAVVEAPAAPAAPAATLNSVQQVQEYRFNPDRYQEF